MRILPRDFLVVNDMYFAVVTKIGKGYIVSARFDKNHKTRQYPRRFYRYVDALKKKALWIKKNELNRHISARRYEKYEISDIALEIVDRIREGVALRKKNIGITGSYLLGFENENSDIDIVAYGTKAYIKIVKNLFEIEGIERLRERDWIKVYMKRCVRYPFRTFLFHERRKKNRGILGGHMFDILPVTKVYRISQVQERSFFEFKGNVLEDRHRICYPAKYNIEGFEVFSYDFNFLDQVREGEKAYVKGELEVTKDKNRVYVGEEGYLGLI